MATIQEAIEYSKKNPNTAFASELRRRIESGQMNKELESAGLNQYITKPQVQEQSLSSKIGNTIKDTGKNIESTITDNSKGVISRGVGATSQAFGGVLGVAGDIANTIPGVETATKAIGNVIGKGVQKIADNKYVQAYAKDLEKSVGLENLQTASDLGNISNSILAVSGGAKSLQGGVDTAVNVASKVKSGVQAGSKELTTGANQVIDRISSPNVSDATRVSLNPVEALKGTGQDMRVTVGGKSKLVSELTPDEITKLKVSTSKSMDSFTKQAENFKNDRSVTGGSPVETVGSRADKALQYADLKRQAVGQKMGEIENKYANEVIQLTKPTIEKFSKFEEILNNSGYGKSLSEIKPIQAMVDDFVKLNKNGLTVAERNSFVRAYDKILRDATDAFGNFKENASAYTDMSRVLKSIKNETVDALTAKDKIYRGLRKQYAEHIKLQEFGDSLLGKDGLLGEKLKGAATVKRAIQSNSDAGARQFLAKLKEITGYDAIQQGDLALTAMKNVGDYQGLSLLNILQEGKSGIIKRALEKGQDMIVGNEAKRVKNFINK